jgi:predicted metal-binding protein
MIEEIWKKMSSDPSAAGYFFKRIGIPSPDAGTMKKCREMCAENLCGEYGVTWGCPPGVGTEEECLRSVKGFSKAAVLTKEYNNIDLKDRGLIEKIGADHQDVCRRFCGELRAVGYKAMPLSDGGCKYCGECTYPDEPCLFPDLQVSSISAYGILMEEYMKAQGIDFEFKDGSMTLYGLILYDET